MTAWAAKRFWSKASAAPCEGGFTVHLDARPVRTPMKSPLILPTLALAEAVAAEWDAQVGVVNPGVMPFTRTANSAIDKVVPQFEEVAGLLAAYGGTDLLCYRAEGPAPLVARQTEGWDPILHWAAKALDAPLTVTTGIAPVSQPAQSLATLHAQVLSLSAFKLAAFHDLVAISGSLILAFAVCRERLSAEEAWGLSRIDENWQAEQWGTDEDFAALEAEREAAFSQAARFYLLCG
jgi:chaperone required for assembly of F1-ATPase